MIFFKACPRCRGDVHETSDLYGPYIECLHCGYMVDAIEWKQKLAQEAAESDTKAA